MTDRKIKNIAFEGGGIKGISHAGVLEGLSHLGFYSKINGWVGSSTGAIIAMLGAIRTRPHNISEMVMRLDFPKFAEPFDGLFKRTYRLMKYFCLYKGQKLDTWILWLCSKHGDAHNITFNEVYKKYDSDLVIVATDIKSAKPVFFDRKDHGDLPIRKAVLASCSMPFYYPVQKIDDKYYIDGSFSVSYPINAFDYYEGEKNNFVANPFTVGCKFSASKNFPTIERSRGLSLERFTNNMLAITMEQLHGKHVESKDWNRTINIDTGSVCAADFGLPEKGKRFLIKQGFEATIKFLKEEE